MRSAIIVTGFANEPDRTSRTGWRERAYARVVSSVEEIGPKENVWSGELRWTDADPEGRHDAGWMGPNGLMIWDSAHWADVLKARSALRRMEAVIAVADNGHKSQEWDDTAQEWKSISSPASDEEVEAGLAAMDAIDGVRQWLEGAMSRTVDGTEAAAALDAFRARVKAERAAKEAAAIAFGNVDGFPARIRELAEIMRGNAPGSMIGVKYNGEIFWRKGQYGETRSSARYQIEEFMPALTPIAQEFLRGAAMDAAELARFNKFFGFS